VDGQRVVVLLEAVTGAFHLSCSKACRQDIQHRNRGRFSWILGKLNHLGLRGVNHQAVHPFGMVGVGGTEIWRFRAVKVGRQTLRLDYARPWETGVAPVKIVSFNVVVQP